MASRGTQENDEPDGTLVVDLEKYSIPDGTRCVSDVIRVCVRVSILSFLSGVLCLSCHF